MGASLFLVVVAACHVLNGVDSAGMLPTTYPRCKQTDPDLNGCLQKAVQAVLPQLKGGIPTLGIASLDPLQVTKLSIGQGQGPISINMDFSNITVKDLSDTTIYSVNADLTKYSLILDGGIALAEFEADYEMNGRILLLPVTGKGHCKLTFKNTKAKFGPQGKESTKKGEKYFDVTNFFLDINNVDKLEVNFDNLFNGDKTLGNTMNTLLNENWKDLWGELKPAFDEGFSKVFHQYSKGFFDKVAFNDIFLE